MVIPLAFHFQDQTGMLMRMLPILGIDFWHPQDICIKLLNTLRYHFETILPFEHRRILIHCVKPSTPFLGQYIPTCHLQANSRLTRFLATSLRLGPAPREQRHCRISRAPLLCRCASCLRLWPHIPILITTERPL